MIVTTNRKTTSEPRSSDTGMTLLRWLIALLVIFVVTRVDALQPMQELQGSVVRECGGHWTAASAEAAISSSAGKRATKGSGQGLLLPDWHTKELKKTAA